MATRLPFSSPKRKSMTRPLRLALEGAYDHITSKGNLRDRIFLMLKIGRNFEKNKRKVWLPTPYLRFNG